VVTSWEEEAKVGSVMRWRIAIAVLAICLWAATANAQPLYVIEHDWTVQIGNTRWGLLQANMAPGDWRTTTVYFGGAVFTVRAGARRVEAFAIVTVGALVVVPLMMRSRKVLRNVLA
jgi:hypothetical protein